MSERYLLELIEDKNIELKKAKNAVPKSFWETYSAFANSDGGLVIFGVDEKSKEVTGVSDPYKVRDDLLNTLNNPQKVSANILKDEDITILTLDNGKHVMLIDIPEASYRIKPVYLNDNPRLAYERLGEGDRRLTPDRYKELVVNSNNQTDNELLRGFGLDDLNENDIEIYKKELYETTRNEKYLTINNRDLLIEIGAIRKDRQSGGEYVLTVGGLLFFGKFNAITDRFPGFQLDYFERESMFSTDWIDRISTGDMGYPELNVYSFFRLVMDKLSRTVKDEFRLDDETKARLPFKSDLLTSVREALVNALIHAYYDSNISIKVTVFQDYYEFINPGKMRVTVDEFIHGGVSDIRNHTMSNIMRRIGYIEKAGSGGPRIFDTAAKYKLKMPEVFREQDRTVVRVWKVDLAETFSILPNNQQKILNYLVESHSISRGQAIRDLGMSEYAFRKTIDELLESEMIESVGSGRGTKYVLKTSTPEQVYSMKRFLKDVEDHLIGL